MRRTCQMLSSVGTIPLLAFLTGTAACDRSPLSDAEDAVSAASQDAGASNAPKDNLDDGHGERIPFDDADVFFEFNTTDNDLGFQVFLDAEGWERVRLADPAGRRIVDFTALSALSELGITELRFESAEPSPAEVLSLFPQGVYSFMGRAVGGELLASTARLSHHFLATPTVSPSDGEAVDRNATVVTWHAPGAQRVEIIIENEDLGHIFDVIVSRPITSLNVPPQFLLPGTEYKIEVLAIAENGNRTIVESTFVTLE